MLADESSNQQRLQLTVSYRFFSVSVDVLRSTRPSKIERETSIVETITKNDIRFFVGQKLDLA